MTLTLPEVGALTEFEFETEDACASRFPELPVPCGKSPVTHLAVPPCGHSEYYCFGHVADIRGCDPDEWTLFCECGADFLPTEMRFVAL